MRGGLETRRCIRVQIFPANVKLSPPFQPMNAGGKPQLGVLLDTICTVGEEPSAPGGPASGWEQPCRQGKPRGSLGVRPEWKGWRREQNLLPPRGAG